MTSTESGDRARRWVTRGFSAVEDAVYIGLGLLLAGAALMLLVSTVMSFVRSLRAGELHAEIIGLLDNILLILLVV